MWAGWRVKLLKKLDIVLIIFELIVNIKCDVSLNILCIIKSPYLRGVSVELMIAWVTSAIAYAVKAWN
ncbi:hypothetical protein [Vulcanisaeta distributa]|uniref:hypothetical protein n=1 Tax=Vulcanisaeta distributa TaxID=164451 RepID=UPI0006D029DF|nr:hypothetical protein [Vulcanisaeta distributa]